MGATTARLLPARFTDMNDRANKKVRKAPRENWREFASERMADSPRAWSTYTVEDVLQDSQMQYLIEQGNGRVIKLSFCILIPA
jgi:hypothetical protein